MKNFQINWRQLAVLAAFVVLFFLLMDFNGRINELNRLNTELAKMETQVSANKATESGLQEQIQYATSDAAVNEYARNNGLVREGEKLIVPLGNSTPVPQLSHEITSTPVKISNRQIWWALFFGD
ncbi:MAG: septum formation initiator family protein [Bellilinea sp.]